LGLNESHDEWLEKHCESRGVVDTTGEDFNEAMRSSRANFAEVVGYTKGVSSAKSAFTLKAFACATRPVWYAADDLETMSEAKRYQAHVFDLLRPYIGSSVLEVGCGIGTTSLRLAEIADRLVCIEPNLNCVSRARAALDGNPKITLRICHLEECDRAELVEQRFEVLQRLRRKIEARIVGQQAPIDGAFLQAGEDLLRLCQRRLL